MTHLFDIAAEYREAAEKLADLDLDEQTIADTLEGMSGALEQKATNIVAMTQEWLTLAGAIKDAETRMAARRKGLELRAARVREYLLNAMLYAGVKKIEGPMFQISTRDNPASVQIWDERQVPADYWVDPPPPAKVLSKSLIAQALKDGFDVPGAKLVQGKRLEVR